MILRREPILIQAVFFAAFNIFNAFDVLSWNYAQMGAANAALAAIIGLLIRQKVTPVLSPHDLDGTPLIRADALPAIPTPHMSEAPAQPTSETPVNDHPHPPVQPPIPPAAL